VCLLLLAPSMLPAAGTDSERPRSTLNVLLITADDMAAELGCYGNPIVRSPNLDRLARLGARFERAYCQFPLCNPSRTSFLSGYRPDTTGIRSNRTPPRQRLGGALFLPEYFSSLGYFTGRVGKIAHGDFASSVRWDVVQEVPTLGPDKCPDSGFVNNLPCREATNNGDEDEPDGMISRQAAALIEAQRGKPFFIAVGFGKPHVPFVCPKRYFDLYDPKTIPLPSALRRNDTKDRLEQRTIAAYYACISFIDAQVGILMDTLERLELINTTVVVFTSDHGLQMGEHGALGRKSQVFEACARVPLIVAAPGKRAEAVSPGLVELVDLYPTLVSLVGLPAKPGLEGTDFSPLLDEPNRVWKNAAFTQARRSDKLIRSVRTRRYRFIDTGNPDTITLYDYDLDRLEVNNVARDPAYAEVVEEMKRILAAGWRVALPPTPRLPVE
jgi:uncharacterized sulfatase